MPTPKKPHLKCGDCDRRFRPSFPGQRYGTCPACKRFRRHLARLHTQKPPRAPEGADREAIMLARGRSVPRE